MNPSEKALFQRIKAKLCQDPRDRFERVENGLVDGMPDVNYCLGGSEGWIELKTPKEPKRPGTALLGSGKNHPLALSQKNWMLAQARAGGRCHLLIGTDRRLMLIDAQVAASLNGDINEASVAYLLGLADWAAEGAIREPTYWVQLRHLLCRRVMP